MPARSATRRSAITTPPTPGENLLEAIRNQLRARKGQWQEIARETGVPYFTMAKIASGKTKNPRVSTLQPLLNWFARHDA